MRPSPPFDAAAADHRPARGAGKRSQRAPRPPRAGALHQLGIVSGYRGYALSAARISSDGVERLEVRHPLRDDDGNRGRELARVRHREIDRAGRRRAPPRRPRRPDRRTTAWAGRRSRSPARRSASDAEAERLADRLLAREAPRVALRRVRPRVAVRVLGLGEAAVAEPGVAVERAPDAPDLDQVGADADQSGAPRAIRAGAAIERDDAVGMRRARVDGVRPELPRPHEHAVHADACAPAMSLSRSSPTIQAISGSASSASNAAAKYAGLGLPSTIASTCAAYSRPATNAPASRSGPRFVCHQRFRCRQ